MIRSRFLKIFLFTTIVFALLWRVVLLHRIPGLNGDEAWWANRMFEAIQGEAWSFRTPFGKPPNPTLAGPLWIFARFFEPDFIWLRIPSVVASFLLVFLAYPLARKPYGREVGFGLTLLFLAWIPILGQSRLGWDPSQSALACFLVWMAAARARWGWATIAFCWAMTVHPTNIFLLPVILAGPAFGRMADYMRGVGARILLRDAVLTVLGMGLVFALLHYTTGDVISVANDTHGAKRRLDGIANSNYWSDYWRSAVHFLSGVTYYEYVTGVVPSSVKALHTLWIRFLLVPTLLGGFLVALFQARTRELGAFLGLGAAFTLFYIRAGTNGFIPGDDRYAQWLLVPVAILFCWSLKVVLELAPRAMRLYPWILGAFAAFHVVSFGIFFLNDLTTYGGARSHSTFKTGPVEPKVAAMEWIRANSPPRADQPVEILTPDFWIQQPMRYLVGLDRSYRVREAAPDERILDGIRQKILAGRSFYVLWPDSEIDLHLQTLRAQGTPVEEFTAKGYGERPLLRVWKRKP